MAKNRRYLLDTSTFLWASTEPGKLTSVVRSALLDESAKRYVSLASVWEMQIKHAVGKLLLPRQADQTARSYASALQVDFLHIGLDHISALYTLPSILRDPFDRMLSAQARIEGLTIISPDPVFKVYGVSVLW